MKKDFLGKRVKESEREGERERTKRERDQRE